VSGSVYLFVTTYRRRDGGLLLVPCLTILLTHSTAMSNSAAAREACLPTERPMPHFLLQRLIPFRGYTLANNFWGRFTHYGVLGFQPCFVNEPSTIPAPESNPIAKAREDLLPSHLLNGKVAAR
jgi:hypothetical protein